MDRSALLSPNSFRRALERVPHAERDSWFDAVLGLSEVPEDGAELPRGCVPYLPCSVDAVLDAVNLVGVDASDVFVDVGAGIGRAALLANLLTGARAVGLEIQPSLVERARALTAGMGVSGVELVVCDAVDAARTVPTGTVFFLYCPFDATRVERFLDALEPVARARPVRLVCVDMPPLARNWLRSSARMPSGATAYFNV